MSVVSTQYSPVFEAHLYLWFTAKNRIEKKEYNGGFSRSLSLQKHTYSTQRHAHFYRLLPVSMATVVRSFFTGITPSDSITIHMHSHMRAHTYTAKWWIVLFFTLKWLCVLHRPHPDMYTVVLVMHHSTFVMETAIWTQSLSGSYLHSFPFTDCAEFQNFKWRYHRF